MSNVRLVGALEFASPAKRKAGLAAFEAERYTEFTALEDWVEDGRALRIDVEREVEVDCVDNYHKAFAALAKAARAGRVELRWDKREGYWGVAFAGGHYLELEPYAPGPLRSLAPGRLMRAYTEWPGRMAERKKTDVRISAAALSPDGAYLAASGGPPVTAFMRTGPDLGQHKIRAHFGVALFEVATGEERWRSFAASETVFALAFSNDGAKLAAAGNDGNVYLIDAKTGETLHTEKKALAGGTVALAFSKDGELLAAGGRPKKVGFREGGSYDQAIKVWRLTDFKLLKEYDKLDHLFGLVFSEDGAGLTAWSLSTSFGDREECAKVFSVKTGAAKTPAPIPENGWDFKDGALYQKAPKKKGR
jgi:WD40 repeat protein